MQFGILILVNRLWKLLLGGVLLAQLISLILVFISGGIQSVYALMKIFILELFFYYFFLPYP
uniref:Photosystem II complex Ycf12 n=1 Tax=Silvianthus bracteatus TaxID=389109 RepID=A0A6H1YIK2_9LAMI|nr:photosystem II complex Ycf12 [Silvianthus bracteatus]QJA28222.1 photosystem II complex Ycf12 [Silvianthus bracteatus]